MKVIKLTGAIILIIIAFILYSVLSKSSPQYPEQLPENDKLSPSVTIEGKTIKVKIARTPDEKAKGLSGTRYLTEDEGMLFEFSPKTKPNFWMKDMVIPIDIIWISDNKVIGIEKSVQPPSPGTPDARLELYYPTSEVDYVLEVMAGLSEKYNITTGSTVILNL